MSSQPSVSVVVVNFNGERHLVDCFDSLQALDYPGEKLEMVCVDNASSDGSLDLLRTRFPEVKIVESGSNLGFAGGCNLGASSSSGEVLAFINNDMRADPGWVRELVGKLDKDAGIVCVGGRILDWEGNRIDFARGSLNFAGAATQVGFGAPAELVPKTDDELLFACGGSLLIYRDVFTDVGGFDDDYFMFFEDVDLGWRLWVLGFRTASAPEAITYHRFHGSAGAIPEFRLRRLYERNALFTIIKNAGQRDLPWLLSAALLLAARRALLELAPVGEAYEVKVDMTSETEDVNRRGIATMVGIDEVNASLDHLMTKRAGIQARRARSDAEIFSHFGRPFQPVLRFDAYLQAQAAAVRAFGVDRTFDERETAMVLIVGDTEPEFQQEWTQRSKVIAESLGGTFEVTYAAAESITERDWIRWVDTQGAAEQHDKLFDYHEVVVMHAARFEALRSRSARVLVAASFDGVDGSSSERWVAAAAEDADLVLDEGMDGLTALHELCRFPDKGWAKRQQRRPSLFTHDVQALLDNWARELEEHRRHSDHFREMVSIRDERVENLEREIADADAEIERLRNHSLMRNYLKLRAALPGASPDAAYRTRAQRQADAKG